MIEIKDTKQILLEHLLVGLMQQNTGVFLMIKELHWITLKSGTNDYP